MKTIDLLGGIFTKKEPNIEKYAYQRKSENET